MGHSQGFTCPNMRLKIMLHQNFYAVGHTYPLADMDQTIPEDAYRDILRMFRIEGHVPSTILEALGRAEERATWRALVECAQKELPLVTDKGQKQIVQTALGAALHRHGFDVPDFLNLELSDSDFCPKPL